MVKPLYKHTVVIWSEKDWSHLDFSPCGDPIIELAKDSYDGQSYCSKFVSKRVQCPEMDGDWDFTEFFDDPEVVDEIVDA